MEWIILAVIALVGAVGLVYIVWYVVWRQWMRDPHRMGRTDRADDDRYPGSANPKRIHDGYVLLARLGYILGYGAEAREDRRRATRDARWDARVAKRSAGRS